MHIFTHYYKIVDSSIRIYMLIRSPPFFSFPFYSIVLFYIPFGTTDK